MTLNATRQHSADLPGFLKPDKGVSGVVGVENMFCTDDPSVRNIFQMWHIGRVTGSAVAVRLV